MPSGLLLVTGPYSVNKVPLKVIHRRYVISTQAKIDVSKVKVSVQDDYFPQGRKSQKKSIYRQSVSYSSKQDKKIHSRREPTDIEVKTQQQVDQQVMSALEKVPQMADYLKSMFTLKTGEFPHLMKF